MQIICHSLDFSNHNHTMLSAACCLGFFGFLRAGEFTLNSPFNPAIHLTVRNIQEDSLINPCSFRIYINCSKMDPFRQGCCIYIGTGRPDLYPVHALTVFTSPWLTLGPLFLLSDGTPLNHQSLSSTIQTILSSAGVPSCFTCQ